MMADRRHEAPLTAFALYQLKLREIRRAAMARRMPLQRAHVAALKAIAADEAAAKAKAKGAYLQAVGQPPQAA